MRWFVEVARVGDNAPAERYCIDAKAWQAALQETRKLRGDSGPLSKFSIELLDDGYRAVDPVQKIRYRVNQAPNDAPIVTPQLNGAARATPSAAPPAVEPALTPTLPTGAHVSTPADTGSHRSNAPAAPRPATRRSTSKTPGREPTPAGASGTPGEDASDVVLAAASLPIDSIVTPEPAAAVSLPPVAPVVTPSAEPIALVNPKNTPRTPPNGLATGARPAEPAAATSAFRGASAFVAPGSIAPSPSPLAATPLVAVPIVPAPAVAVSSASTVPLTAAKPATDERAAAADPAAMRALAAQAQRGAATGSVAPGASAQRNAANHALKATAERSPTTTSTAAAAPIAAAPVTSAAAARGPVPAADGSAAQPSAATSPSPALPASAEETPFEVLTSRIQDPTPEAPITYRELACAVAPGLPREKLERLLRGRWAALKEELAARPAGKLIQIAIFDHKFEHRPERQPLATLTWKDWRGDAVLAYPGLGEAGPPQTGSLPPPAPAAPSTAQPATEKARGLEEAEEPVPLRRPSMKSDPGRSSRSRISVPRRRAGEDLISELFEIMHEVHFARDIAAGADFVMGVIDDLIPCGVRMIQVFDINKRSFVVVRARGAGLERAIMQRTPDKDPLIIELMRGARSRVYNAQKDERFAAGRWSFAEPRPSGEILCGPVRQGGRYLGLIELAAPLGGAPFHETEINALDYICEQFADFVASRPVVLEADVILGR